MALGREHPPPALRRRTLASRGLCLSLLLGAGQCWHIPHDTARASYHMHRRGAQRSLLPHGIGSSFSRRRVSVPPLRSTAAASSPAAAGIDGDEEEAAATPFALPSESEAVAESAVATLAATTLALLAGDEESARSLAGGAAAKRRAIRDAFEAYDVCESGTLSVEEARALFTNLSRKIVTELANGDDARENARAHARRVLAADEAGDTIGRVATKLLLLADLDGDGRVSLPELADMFETVHRAQAAPRGGTSTSSVETFPQPLRALAGSLQLLPPAEGTDAGTAAGRTAQWNAGVPGDDHSLRRVELERGLSVVGLGRSADASSYFLPELGLVLDAGMHVKSLAPKCVLLTHGHRDHIAALPTHAAGGAKILAPRPIAPLVKRFLLAEAQLNYGDPTQTDDQTVAALGDFDVEPVEDGASLLLPRSCYAGSPTPLGVEVFGAPHKDGVPAVSYGLYRSKSRLKPMYADLPKNELGALLRNDVSITEPYEEGLLFYTGDTTIELLRERWRDILPKYRNVIHEVTFLGAPSSDLDDSAKRKGHTHYAQLHPWICAFPETTFICVHWSLRYGREDILDFFEEQYGGVPKNVVLWV